MEKTEVQRIKIGIISSRGGHLFELIRLKKFWRKYDRFWITFPGLDVEYYLKKEQKYYGMYPDSRNILNAIRNLFFSFIVLHKERPKWIISSGAGIAVPFLLAAKLFRIKTMFIEPYDFVSYPSLAGKIVYCFTDLFIVQHLVQKKWYPKAQYLGSIL